MKERLDLDKVTEFRGTVHLLDDRPWWGRRWEGRIAAMAWQVPAPRNYRYKSIWYKYDERLWRVLVCRRFYDCRSAEAWCVRESKRLAESVRRRTEAKERTKNEYQDGTIVSVRSDGEV